MKSYPTTIEEDEAILAQPGHSFTYANCIQLRYNEKKIMRYMDTTADLFLRLLPMTKKEANLEINKLEDFKDKFVYFKRVQKIMKD